MKVVRLDPKGGRGDVPTPFSLIPKSKCLGVFGAKWGKFCPILHQIYGGKWETFRWRAPPSLLNYITVELVNWAWANKAISNERMLLQSNVITMDILKHQLTGYLIFPMFHTNPGITLPGIYMAGFIMPCFDMADFFGNFVIIYDSDII